MEKMKKEEKTSMSFKEPPWRHQSLGLYPRKVNACPKRGGGEGHFSSEKGPLYKRRTLMSYSRGEREEGVPALSCKKVPKKTPISTT